MLSSDLYSAIFLLLGGAAGLLMLQALRWFALRKMPHLQGGGSLENHFERVIERFETRRRWSWVMLFVGTLWLVQLGIESKIQF